MTTNKRNKELELKLQTQSSRILFVKIEILDTKNNVVNEASGSAISGSYNIDSSSAIRRTCSITFNLENGYIPNPNSIFWINKRFRLYIGLYNIENATSEEPIYWFDKGVYVIKDPTVNISVTENNITINGLDKMALHTGDISGQLETAFITETVDSDNKPIYVENAIEALMKDSGETNLLIAKTDMPLPYKIESGIGDTRWDLISKFTELFYNYQAYYNLDGYFVFDKKPMYQSMDNITNDIVMDFSQEYTNTNLETIPYNLLISVSKEIVYSNVKNKIVVYGGVHDDGFQPYHTIIIDNKNYPKSPYTVEKLNEVNEITDENKNTLIYRTLVIQEDLYVDSGEAKNINDNLAKVHAVSMQLCKDRALQEVYLHQQTADKITITCLPIYSLDVNEVIKLDDGDGVSEYVISNISCGLSANDTMSITANKLW